MSGAPGQYRLMPGTVGVMEDRTTASTLTERQSVLITAGGRLALNDAAIDALGGIGSWIHVEINDGVVTLRPSALHPETIAAVLAMPLDTDET
jgi:hypothetical protein